MKSPIPTHKGQRVFVHRYKDGHSSRRVNYRRKLKEGKVRITVLGAARSFAGTRWLPRKAMSGSAIRATNERIPVNAQPSRRGHEAEEAVLSDWCFHCEQPLVRLRHGGLRQCCEGMGYWSTAEPLPRDNLMPIVKARGSVTGVIVYLYMRVGPSMVAI